jgi:hypothetical protein
MTTDLLSLSLSLFVLGCLRLLPPFVLCLVVLARTGKTKGFRDVAAVFGPASGSHGGSRQAMES